MEERIARICYNEFGWTRPSGRNGKGSMKKSYEYKNSFGHEEWLFDKTRILNGYHYGFLQAMNGFMYAGQKFDVHLYAYSKAFGKLYLGVIHNVECLDEDESAWALNEYIKKGWLEEMKEDIRAIGGKPEALDDDKYSTFNIRFKFSDVSVNLSNPKIISQEDPSTKAKYYKLYPKKGDFVFSPVADTRRNGVKRKAARAKSEHRVVFNTDFKRTEYDPLHNKIQNAVKKILLRCGEYSSVTLEENFVDISATTHTGEIHFFEVKTAPAKKSIRDAIGQVMEYAYYPGEKRADKLIIIAPDPADEFDCQYLRHIRKEFGLPVWFRHYSFLTNDLSPLQ